MKKWRYNLAKSKGIPAYIIFHDSVLKSIAQTEIKTLNELLRIKGIGRKKLADYGNEVLEIIRRK